MDTTLIYEVITAAIAVSSGFAGARAAHLSRRAGGFEAPTGRVVVKRAGSDLTRLQRAVREAISEGCLGAQNAAAWLAASTALFGVATTRSATDPFSIIVVLIGTVLVTVAIRALLEARDAAKLPPARAAFEIWYLAWTHEPFAANERPSDDQIASAFAEENVTFASTLRKFNIWPFPPKQIGHTRPASEFIRGWG